MNSGKLISVMVLFIVFWPTAMGLLLLYSWIRDRKERNHYTEYTVWAFNKEELMFKSLGEIGYEAYRESSGGVSLISGQPIPEFAKLPGSIKVAWEAAGAAVIESAGGPKEPLITVVQDLLASDLHPEARRVLYTLSARTGIPIVAEPAGKDKENAG